MADQSFVAASEVEPSRAVTYCPAAGAVWMTLDAEPLGIGELLAAAGRVAPPITGQVPAQVTTDVHGVRLGRVVVDDPQLFLAQRRASRVDLEAERLGGEISSAAV